MNPVTVLMVSQLISFHKWNLMSALKTQFRFPGIDEKCSRYFYRKLTQNKELEDDILKHILYKENKNDRYKSEEQSMEFLFSIVTLVFVSTAMKRICEPIHFLGCIIALTFYLQAVKWEKLKYLFSWGFFFFLAVVQVETALFLHLNSLSLMLILPQACCSSPWDNHAVRLWEHLFVSKA